MYYIFKYFYYIIHLNNLKKYNILQNNLKKITKICIIKILFVFIIIWVYLTVCLFLMGIGKSFYIQTIPIIKNDETYIIHSFIPLCLFTSYFNKLVLQTDVIQ